MDNIQYMDIIIFQLEQLLKKAETVNLKISDDILTSMHKWFENRVKEINRTLKADGGVEMNFSSDKPFSVGSILGQLLGITAHIKAGLSGSLQRADTIRTNFKNRFTDFSPKFNTFIEQVNEQLRREKKGKEVLFIHKRYNLPFRHRSESATFGKQKCKVRRLHPRIRAANQQYL